MPLVHEPHLEPWGCRPLTHLSSDAPQEPYAAGPVLASRPSQEPAPAGLASGGGPSPQPPVSQDGPCQSASLPPFPLHHPHSRRSLKATDSTLLTVLPFSVFQCGQTTLRGRGLSTRGQNPSLLSTTVPVLRLPILCPKDF